MPFKVRNAKLLEGRTAGDLVKATLVVEDNDAYLSAVEQTGHAAVSAWPPAPAMDVLAEGETVPDVDLTDDTGARRRLSEWRGRPVAVTFIYTRCPLPDFCPRMDRNFAEVQRRVLAEPSMRDHIRLLSISFDPGFDTPPVLASHAQHAGADPRVWRFATGDPDAIAAFASRLGLSVVRDGAATANVVHNLRTAVIGADGRLVTILNGNDWRPEQLLDALERRRE